MGDWRVKRFWKTAAVVAEGDGFAVRLDNRPLRTPAKAALVVPTEGLAQAVAREWQDQDGDIDPTAMPFTRSANAAIDKVSVQFDEVAALIAEYGDADLVCYRATEPEELVNRQAAAWDPLIAWAAREFGAALHPVAGVVHVAQPAESVAVLRSSVSEFDAFGLTALHDLVSLSGSLVLGLAAAHRAFDVGDLWARSRVDEDWQIEAWGEDDEAKLQSESRRKAFFHAEEFRRLAAAQT